MLSLIDNELICHLEQERLTVLFLIWEKLRSLDMWYDPATSIDDTIAQVTCYCHQR
jgi:hypothetical protein